MSMSQNSQNNNQQPPKSLPPKSITSHEGLGYESSGNDQNVRQQKIYEPSGTNFCSNPMKSIGQLFVRDNIENSIFNQLRATQHNNISMQQQAQQNQKNLHQIDQNQEAKISHSIYKQSTTTMTTDSIISPKVTNFNKKTHRFTDIKALSKEKKSILKRQSTNQINNLKRSTASNILLQNNKIFQELGRKSKNYTPQPNTGKNQPDNYLQNNGAEIQKEYLGDRMAQIQYQLHRIHLINRVKVPQFVLSFQDFQQIEIPTIRDLRFEGAEIMDKDTAHQLESKYSNKRENNSICSRTPRYIWIIVILMIIFIICLGVGLGVAYG